MADIRLAMQKYADIRKLVSAYKFVVSEHKEINYGLQFSVKRASWSGLVRIYQNKKGQVKVDLSQVDQSSDAIALRTLIETGNLPDASQKTATAVSKSSNTSNSKLNVSPPYIGSDESGKGDYFGPLVVACVYVSEQTAKRLTELGVKDSKTIKDPQIIQLAKQIRTLCRDQFEIVEIAPERYNQLYNKLKKEKKTLNDMLAWAHAKALESLLERVESEVAVVDKFCDDALLLGKLQEKGKALRIVQVHRAESYVAVAAASILARERYVTSLDKLGKDYEIQLPKGASPDVIAVAQRLVKANGDDIFDKITKRHFKTTEAVFRNR